LPSTSDNSPIPAADRELRVSEIFYSLQGESRTVGFPTVFIRLTGCPLRCGYCDTSYAFSGGKRLTLSEILKQVAAYEARYVTVTGGEPLAQRDCWLLLKMLCDAGYSTSRKDQVKFVITDRADYEWSRHFIEEKELSGKFEILFSPVHGELDPAEMAEWILADNLQVRMQIQLHKYLWGDERGR
jgi:7-carboxy-7-deazaguanine synthase